MLYIQVLEGRKLNSSEAWTSEFLCVSLQSSYWENQRAILWFLKLLAVLKSMAQHSHKYLSPFSLFAETTDTFQVNYSMPSFPWPYFTKNLTVQSLGYRWAKLYANIHTIINSKNVSWSNTLATRKFKKLNYFSRVPGTSSVSLLHSW